MAWQLSLVLFFIPTHSGSPIEMSVGPVVGLTHNFTVGRDIREDIQTTNGERPAALGVHLWYGLPVRLQ
jgi:hypothetical protein